MKFKKCIPVLLVLSLVLNVFLVKKTIDDYHEFQRQGIWGLNYAAFHLVTLMPEMEDPEDWTAAATTMGQTLQAAHVMDKEDNLAVYHLIQAVSQVHGSQDRTELRKALGELTIRWNTKPGELYCTVVKGDVDKIMELCGYD